jgi:micrococcal nuclease
MRGRAPLALLLALLGAPLARAATYSAEEAGRHAGETATVCGTVVSAHFSQRSKTQPTFLNLDKSYPDQVFTIVIFGRDRAKFGTPETALLRQRLCATGPITLYQGRPEMIVAEPSQLQR